MNKTIFHQKPVMVNRRIVLLQLFAFYTWSVPISFLLQCSRIWKPRRQRLFHCLVYATTTLPRFFFTIRCHLQHHCLGETITFSCSAPEWCWTQGSNVTRVGIASRQQWVCWWKRIQFLFPPQDVAANEHRTGLWTSSTMPRTRPVRWYVIVYSSNVQTRNDPVLIPDSSTPEIPPPRALKSYETRPFTPVQLSTVDTCLWIITVPVCNTSSRT